jgi:hypothetical protein
MFKPVAQFLVFAIFMLSTVAAHASKADLAQMRAALGEMQKQLQQQQVRIEQLEKLAVAPSPENSKPHWKDAGSGGTAATSSPSDQAAGVAPSITPAITPAAKPEMALATFTAALTCSPKPTGAGPKAHAFQSNQAA